MPRSWYKLTDGMSVGFRGQLVDLMARRNRQVTGKVFGLHSKVKRDSKFKNKKYEYCSQEYVRLLAADLQRRLWVRLYIKRDILHPSYCRFNASATEVNRNRTAALFLCAACLFDQQPTRVGTAGRNA